VQARSAALTPGKASLQHWDSRQQKAFENPTAAMQRFSLEERVKAMTLQIDTKQLIRLRFTELDSLGHLLFGTWVTNMTMERDGEYGADRTVAGKYIPGFWSWIKEQNESPEFRASDLFGTFVWTYQDTHTVVATGTIAPDDRDVKAEYNLGGDGLWGGVNVCSYLRGQGIGRHICKQLDEHVAAHAKTQPRLFHLFTANPVAEKIYTKLGYAPNVIGEINTEAFGGERLYSKHYGIG
jgi:GNAT superfamily N-acetyltransferase